MNLEKEEKEAFLFRYVDTHKLLLQPLDVFGLALRTTSHELEICKNCSSIRLGNSIFHTGGADEKGQATNSFLEVTLDFALIESQKPHTTLATVLPAMPSVKVFHGIGVLNGTDIVVVGGFGEDKKETVACAKYEQSTKSWTEISPILKALSFISVESVHGEFLYTFGGSNAIDKVSSVIMKYTASLNVWDPVDLIENQGWKGAVGAISALINENQIIIFGGEGKEGCVKVSYLLDIREATLRKATPIGEELPAETLFPVCKETYEDKVYCVHQDKCHIYDIKTNQWTYLYFDLN